ncbi:uncharacterized protein LOC124135591 [Haliotis rufescens]|uniref:uncharacterized protein LOC124135591 n=1 Tax=Haliotis rufescens TaxID=6454 RepID=UPI00201F2808|nr:uncharacterized protein LOC124135591 [Haliotis rufescens]
MPDNLIRCKTGDTALECPGVQYTYYREYAMLFEAVLRLCIFLPYISGLILPLTTPDGNADLPTILSHVTLLQQTVDILHKNTNQLQTDLRATNEQLQLTQSDLNMTRHELQTSRTDLQVTRTDLQVTKDELQHTQTEFQITKKDLQIAQTELVTYKGLQQTAAAEIMALKNDTSALRTELVLVKAKVENINLDVLPMNSTTNDSLLVSLSGGVRANQAHIKANRLDVQSLHNDLNTTAYELSEFQSDVNSFKQNVSFVLGCVTEECVALKSDSNLFSSLKSDITAMDKKLSVLNTTVHEVRRYTENTSSVIHPIAHKQLVENLETQSIKTLAQDTSAELKKFEEDANSTDVSLSTQLNQLEKRVNSTSVCIHNVQQNILSLQTDLNTTREDITVTNSEVHVLKQNMSDAKKLSSDTQQALAQLAKTLAAETRAVAFQAYVSRDQNVNVTSLHPVVYDSIIYNIRSGYSNTTGKFTAPVSGTYMFWTQMGIHHMAVTPVTTIKQSGRTIGSGWVVSTPTSDYDEVSVSCVSHLQKGEEVWVAFDKINVWFAYQKVTVTVHSLSNNTDPKSYFGGALLTVD